MKKILAVLAIALAGCGVQPLKTGKVEPGVSELQVKAQSIINEGYRVLASIDKEIGQSAADRIFTSADAQKYLNQAIEYRKQLDGYQKLLNKGDISGALSQADVTNRILNTLLEEIVAKAAAARKAKQAVRREEPIFLSA